MEPSIIANTLYYREYLDKDLIPKTALIEYGELAGLEKTMGHEDHNVLLDVFLRPNDTLMIITLMNTMIVKEAELSRLMNTSNLKNYR